MIDVNDWENNTDYEGYNKDDITIIYFWKVFSALKWKKNKYIIFYVILIIINIFLKIYIIYIVC